MCLKPLRSELSDLLESPAFFEQVTCAGNDLESFDAWQLCVGLPIEFDHRLVIAAYDEQCGRGYLLESGSCQVRPAAARHDGADFRPKMRRRGERRRGTGAGPEI